MRTAAPLMVGRALGISGTFGVLALLDGGSADRGSFRTHVRDGLAGEWGDIYAKCMQNANEPAASDNPFESSDLDEGQSGGTRAQCRRHANTVLP